MLAVLLPILAPILERVTSKFFPNPADELKRMEIQQQFQLELVKSSAELEKSAADIIKTEAASQHWLAANWRPLTALIFVGLIVARWLGFTAPNMTEPEYLAVYDIIQIMIGGYVISRGAEKVIPAVFSARKEK